MSPTSCQTAPPRDRIVSIAGTIVCVNRAAARSIQGAHDAAPEDGVTFTTMRTEERPQKFALRPCALSSTAISNILLSNPLNRRIAHARSLAQSRETSERIYREKLQAAH